MAPLTLLAATSICSFLLPYFFPYFESRTDYVPLVGHEAMETSIRSEMYLRSTARSAVVFLEHKRAYVRPSWYVACHRFLALHDLPILPKGVKYHSDATTESA